MRTFFARLVCSLSLCFALTTPAFAASSYTVQHGDTLSAIAQRQHVSVEKISALNHLSDANFLRDGQVLRLAAAPVVVHRHPLMKQQTLQQRKMQQRTFRSVHARVNRPPHIAKRQIESRGQAQVAETRALWEATHVGSSAPDFTGNRSFAAAQKALTIEIGLTRTALRYLGVPYLWGGESFSGVDCSGFVQAVFRHNGIELPRTADAMYEVGRRVTTARLRPGDLVFFETYSAGASHVGIYIGDGDFVHASASHGVRVDSLGDGYYSSRFLGARREAI